MFDGGLITENSHSIDVRYLATVNLFREFKRTRNLPEQNHAWARVESVQRECDDVNESVDQ